MSKTDGAAHGFKQRLPLWQPKVVQVGNRWIAGAVLVVVVCLLLVMWLEAEFFSGAASPLEVEILRLDGSAPAKGPTSYRYWVRLPDGSESRLVSLGVHRPGEHVAAMASRGRLTGRVWLSGAQGLRVAP